MLSVSHYTCMSHHMLNLCNHHCKFLKINLIPSKTHKKQVYIHVLIITGTKNVQAKLSKCQNLQSSIFAYIWDTN